MRILVIGASGFLGKLLVGKLVQQGSIVYGLSRHPLPPSKNFIPLVGDVTLPNLGLESFPDNIEAVYHLAAVLKLGDDKKGEVWNTNVGGTTEVVRLCEDHNIPRLFFCSTAYTIEGGRNTYERSKTFCEELILESSIPRITIFKPSIVIGTEDDHYPGHLSQFISSLMKVHKRTELIRRKIEGSLRLPVIEPVFRLRGDPLGSINLVTVIDVIRAMAEIKEPGTYWLTNSKPPTLGDVISWIGDETLIKLEVLPDFKSTPLEAAFHKWTKHFDPYFYGDSLKSDLIRCNPITRSLVHQVVISTLNN